MTDAVLTVALLRRRYPDALVCVRCVGLLATRRESYRLTGADRLAYVCAECRVDDEQAARLQAVRRETVKIAQAVRRDRRRLGARNHSLDHQARVGSEAPHAVPPQERESETGRYDSATWAGSRQGARRGGRPRVHPDRRAAVAAAARAYRARKRHPPAAAGPVLAESR